MNLKTTKKYCFALWLGLLAAVVFDPRAVYSQNTYPAMPPQSFYPCFVVGAVTAPLIDDPVAQQFVLLDAAQVVAGGIATPLPGGLTTTLTGEVCFSFGNQLLPGTYIMAHFNGGAQEFIGYGYAGDAIMYSTPITIDRLLPVDPLTNGADAISLTSLAPIDILLGIQYAPEQMPDDGPVLPDIGSTLSVTTTIVGPNNDVITLNNVGGAGNYQFRYGGTFTPTDYGVYSMTHQVIIGTMVLNQPGSIITITNPNAANLLDEQVATASISNDQFEASLINMPAAFAFDNIQHTPDATDGAEASGRAGKTSKELSVEASNGTNAFAVPLNEMGGTGTLMGQATSPEGHSFKVPYRYRYLPQAPAGQAVHSANRQLTYTFEATQQHLTIFENAFNLLPQGLPDNLERLSAMFTITGKQQGVAGTLQFKLKEALNPLQKQQARLYQWNTTTSSWVQASQQGSYQPKTGTYDVAIQGLGTYALFTQVPATLPEALVAITQPAANAVLPAAQNHPIKVEATHTGPIEKIVLFENDVEVGQVPGNAGAIDWAGTPGNTYQLQAVAYTAEGVAYSAARTITITVESQQPLLSLVYPENEQSYIEGNELTVHAALEYSNEPPIHVDFYADNEWIGQGTAASARAFSISWPAHNLGQVALSARALFTDGTTLTTDNITINIYRTNSLPDIAITGVGGQPATTAEIEVFGAAPVAVTFEATDAEGPVSTIALYANGALVGELSGGAGSIDWQPDRAGYHLLTAVATDAQGGQAQAPAVPVVVTTNQAPTIAMETELVRHDAEKGTLLYIVHTTVNDPEGEIALVQWYVGGTLLRSETTGPYTITVEVPYDGNTTLEAEVVDGAGARTLAAPIILGGNQPPTVALASEAHLQVLNQPQAVTLTAQAADLDGQVQEVRYYVNGTLTAQLNEQPYTLTLNNPAPGSYQVAAVAYDDKGSLTTSMPVNFRVNHPPQLALPDDLAAVYHEQADFVFAPAITDADGTPVELQLMLNGQPYATTTDVAQGTPVTITNTGQYTLTAIAFDNDGGSTAIDYPFTVNALPTLSVAVPALIEGGRPWQVALQAKDRDGKVASAALYLDNALLAQKTDKPYTFTVNDLAAGTYTLRAEATDNLGGSRTQLLPLAVNSVPTARLTDVSGQQPNATNQLVLPATGQYTINTSAADADGNIAQVQWQLNGLPMQALQQPPYQFNWQVLSPGQYQVAVAATDNSGSITTSSYEVTVCPECLPEGPGDLKAWPNPFSGAVNLMYDLAEQSNTTIVVYDALGHATTTLLSNQLTDAGRHQVTFNLGPLAKGLYLVQLFTNGRPAGNTRIVKTN